MSASKSLPKIVVFSLGGTIASTDSGSTPRGVTPQLSGADIVATVPQLDRLAVVESISVRQVPSGDLTVEDIVELSRQVEQALTSGADGVVVTQGTDTMEETAFILDLLVRSERPVVVTGAMRSPGSLSADGAANLMAAVTVATSSAALALGTLVVLNDEIHAARFVRKTNVSSLAAFQSPNAGPLGWLVEGRVRLAMRVAPLASIGSVLHRPLASVALVKLSLGDEGRIVRGLASMDYSGVVIEGFGGGHVPAKMVAVIEELVGVMPVVLASRTGSGELLRETYGYPGSERDLLARGVWSAGVLDGLKARILLSLVLTDQPSRSQARDRFESITSSIAL